MGCVLLAERGDGAFEQRVAVKLVESAAPGLVRRFRQERRILASLDHPHVARLLDGGALQDGRPYLVMEYVDGQPITDYADAKRLPIETRVRLFAQVCEAVAYAHRNLVVHRDLKPSNIFVTEDEAGRPRVKLLDFGIAKLLDFEDEDASSPLTRTGARLLTPDYASPEQVRGAALTTASDVYQLGVVLYELLTGQRPYQLGTLSPANAERIICETDPARPSLAVTQGEAPPDEPGVDDARRTTRGGLGRALRGDLDRIVLKALRKEPERRYDSASGLGEDLHHYLAGRPVSARPDSAGYRMRRFVGRHRLGVAAAATFLVLLIGYAATVTVQQAQTARERDRAERINRVLLGIFGPASPAPPTPQAGTSRLLSTEGLPGTGDEPYYYFHIMAWAYERAGLWEDLAVMGAVYYDLARAEYPPVSPEVAHATCIQGRVHHRLGDSEAAGRWLSECAAISRAVYGLESTQLGVARANLALIHDPRAFADTVIWYEPGIQRPNPRESSSDSTLALGPPDYAGEMSAAAVSIGFGGSLTVGFVDNVLVDGPGPDLAVYEVGALPEPIRIAISQDGRDYVEAGVVYGGEGLLDISPVAQPGVNYHFVRITDTHSPEGPMRWGTPGSDIDAVIALPAAGR